MQIASPLMERNREMRRRRSSDSKKKGRCVWLRFYYLVALCVFWGATLDFSKNQSWREVLKVKWHSANSWRLRAAIFVFVCRGVTRASCEEQEELCVCRNIAAPPLCYVSVLLSLPTSDENGFRTFNKHRRSFYFS
jgi:hypothetical protein